METAVEPDTKLSSRERLLSTDLRRANRRLAVLSESGRALSGSLKLSETLAGLARLCVPELAAWCVIDLVDSEGRLSPTGSADSDPKKTRLLRRLRRLYPPAAGHPIYEVFRDGRPRLENGVGEELFRDLARDERHLKMMRRLGAGAYLCVPIEAHGERLGVLTLGQDARGPSFSLDDLSLAQELGRCAASAIANARSFRRAQEAEERLARGHAELKFVLDSVPAMIWYKDDLNRIIRCNAPAALWAGLPAAEIEGRSAYELFPRDEAESFHRADLEVIRSGRPVRGEMLECWTPSGKKRWMQNDRFPFSDAWGRASVVIFALDVTERIEAERRLAQKERAQRDLVANVSHEFRTPVAAIHAAAETLLGGALADPENREGFVRMIGAQSRRLGGLVEDMLTLSFLDSREGLSRAPVDVSRLVLGVARTAGALAKARGVALSCGVPYGLVAKVDETHLRQALDHLLSNALLYNRPGGRARMELVPTGRELRFTVRDSGIGIPAKSLRGLFEPFVRAQRGAGPGMGLCVVRKIVEAHGGRVWAESRLGRGSSFHFAIPR